MVYWPPLRPGPSRLPLPPSSRSCSNPPSSTAVSRSAVNGVATFSNLSINATGSYNLTATDGGLPSAQSNPFNIVAKASRLVFTQQPNGMYTLTASDGSLTTAVSNAFV